MPSSTWLMTLFKTIQAAFTLIISAVQSCHSGTIFNPDITNGDKLHYSVSQKSQQGLDTQCAQFLP